MRSSNTLPLALHSFSAWRAPSSEHANAAVDLRAVVSSGLADCQSASPEGLRVHMPEGPTLCAGRLLHLKHLVTAMLAIASRESPQGLSSDLLIERLPTHVSITVTSDRATQTPELGPLFEAFNAYSSSLSQTKDAVSYTPRMKVISCEDRRFSRLRVNLPHLPCAAADAGESWQTTYEPCLRAG
jgi:hypothetical protein